MEAVPPRGDLRRFAPDALLGLLATAFGAVSLLYPLGRDQALFHYAAREWLLRGQVLYRDVWDHKPPVVYLIHMLTIAVLGEHPWGIRLVELVVGVPVLAVLAARLASPQDVSRGAPGTVGAVWLGIAVFYYGYSGFWDTAQVELWVAVFIAASFVAVRHARTPRRGAILGGTFAALAVLTKPPAIFLVFPCFAAGAARALRQGVGRPRAALAYLGAWTLGVALVAAPMLGYFAARGALAPMLDILVGANGAYVVQEAAVHSLADVALHTSLYFSSLEPFSGLFVAILALAAFVSLSLRDGAFLGRYLSPVGLMVATYAGVLAQLKFYGYHWQPLALPAGIFAGTVYGDMARVARFRGGRWLAPLGFAATAACLFVASVGPFQSWLGSVRVTTSYLLGRTSREELARHFDLPLFFANHDSVVTGDWLREHAAPGDTVVVRAFEPQIYALSGLHYTGRFFWTAFLTMPTRPYKRQEWLEEDVAELRAHPPRWAVTLTGATRGLDSPGWFEASGYVRRAELGNFTVLERGSP